ncbi:hypothetical protein [Archangium sp.]|uniref:hypothetical protein n=1 Tax=Archangium sp. TaxID=1872627 RepID=UPI002D4E50A9|nr:hypothetical protein [Archangium sp.]HYO60006.1 hypothetical protein [Archangium sp.]
MQLEVENGMKASGHQGHGMWMGEGKAGVVLHMGGELNASVTKTRLSWMAGQSARDRGNRLASFAGANRAHLAVLTRAAVTAGLREVVTGVTCLASVRPLSPRLTVARLVLDRDPGFSPVRTIHGELVKPAHGDDIDVGMDEGGIYSW